MKEGWEYKTLGEVGLFISGYTPKKNELNSSSGTPYFKVSDMNRLENQITLTYSDLYIKTPKKIFPKGSIVFPKNGGAIYTEKKRFLSQDSVIDLNSEAIFADENYIIKEYLFYFLSSIKISSFDNGGGLPSININRMKECSVPLPNIDEQRRIVSYLDSSFKLIDEIKNKALKSLTEAKALFQSALAEAMEPKEGWEEKTLGEIATEMYRGSGIKRDQITPIGFPCLRYGEIYTTYNYSFSECISHTNESIISPKKYFEKGDILFAITGESVEDIGKCIAYTGKEKCLLGGDIVAMKHNQYPQFLAYALSTKEAIRQKGLGKVKLKVVHTNIPALKTIRIYLPNLPTQKQIVSRLDKLSSKVRAIEEKYQKMVEECDALKQAMLRDVFE